MSLDKKVEIASLNAQRAAGCPGIRDVVAQCSTAWWTELLAMLRGLPLELVAMRQVGREPELVEMIRLMIRMEEVAMSTTTYERLEAFILYWRFTGAVGSAVAVNLTVSALLLGKAAVTQLAWLLWSLAHRISWFHAACLLCSYTVGVSIGSARVRHALASVIDFFRGCSDYMYFAPQRARLRHTQTECAVCLASFAEPRTDGRVRTLTCGHRFHQSCVQPWLAGGHRCPLCGTAGGAGQRW